MSQTLETITRFMREESLMLVTAESCTAGLIAATLADAPGAGQLLDCAFVVYSPEAKQRCLSVNPKTIEQFNLTSEAVAREMALGALRHSRANLAIANTGVADQVDDDIPAGTQCFAWAFVQLSKIGIVVFSETRRFGGARNEIREASAHYALTRIPYFFGQLKTRLDQA